MPRVRLDGGVFGTTNNPTASVAAGVWSMKELEKYQRANLWPPPGSGIVPDTYFNRTTLLLHGDGTNNANNTVFVDSSTNAFTVTTSGKPYQGTFSPFSQTGWSNYFASGTSDFLSIADNAAFAPTTAFTVEAWIYPTVDARGFIVDQMKDNSATGSSWYMYMESGRTIQFGYYSGSTAYNIASSALTLNTWTHVAGVWNGTALFLYINGVQASTTSTSATPNDSSLTVKIGAREASGSTAGFDFFSGYISNVRFVKNTAVYTGAFTPPITPLTAVSGTSLLTCQSNSYKDNSTNAFTVTPSGSPSVQPFSPLAPTSAYSTSAVGGSIYTSSGNYLTLPDNAVFKFGSSNFTVECWVYLTTVPAEVDLISKWNSSGNAGTVQWLLYLVNGVATFLTSTDGTNISATATGATLVANQWYHLAAVRNGNSLTMYVNGVGGTAVSQTGSLYGSETEVLGISYRRNNGSTQFPLTGNITDVRITNGSALYTANFTPPTAPLTAVTNTKLLLNATNAGIIDHTAKNVITTAAGANISTTQSKYGGSSISLSGTSTGYLQLLSSNFNTIPASTDFTLECWVYTTASNRAPNVWHNVSSQKIIAFFLSSSDFNNISTIMGPFSYPGSNASVVRGTTNIVANTWTHVAFVRSGSTITVYVDGTACGTGTSSYASLPLQLIGAISTGATTPDFYFFPGYIDDLRLTIGVARYTSNFTPSTIAFLDQ